uniref:Adhesion G protein-coupled receptor E14 n=1 Tax=Sinocyclocheilus rhinocerous TaxID=307959 RepID=A0A673GFT0_9TELE
FCIACALSSDTFMLKNIDICTTKSRSLAVFSLLYFTSHFYFCHTGSAAVAFMSYNTMENLLKPDFFNTSNTIKTMMSTVISATLPKTTNTKLTKPVNFTLKHIRFDPSGSLSCVYWNISEWIVDGCSVLKTNSSYTVCSCDHLSTFALNLLQEFDPSGSLSCVLALLTFALCQWSPGVNNVARINICISLLLAHLLFLIIITVSHGLQVLCAVISGLLHFLFLSGFVWMFIEAVLLFICVKNLSQISSKKREVLSSGFLCVIGYLVALVVVCVSVGLVPDGYGSEHCWIKMDKGFIWSFLGPVCIILALNMILFICIIISLNSSLTKLNADVSIMVFKTLGQCVVLGCSWILGFFTNGSKVLEILFLILNSQQGTFIFLIYCVLNNEVRHHILLQTISFNYSIFSLSCLSHLLNLATWVNITNRCKIYFNILFCRGITLSILFSFLVKNKFLHFEELF